MGSDTFPEPLRAAGVTSRELEIFWLVGDRLHNREIADSLQVSERTVESHVSSLLRKLGGPNRLALVDAAARLRVRRDPGSVLPRPLSSFVGRTRESEDLLRLVDAHRLLTLTGPAGTGKTRLALRLAHSVTTLPPAVLVDLASVPPRRHRGTSLRGRPRLGNDVRRGSRVRDHVPGTGDVAFRAAARRLAPRPGAVQPRAGHPEHRDNLLPGHTLRTALRDRLGPANFASALATGHRTPLTSLLSR
jgi:DNA-binding CsgD family transcriptional regulator